MTEPSPSISRIVVFSVKSLDPAEVQHARVLRSGALDGDRRWGIFDVEGRCVNGKRHAAVYRLRSHFDADARTLALTDESSRGLPRMAFSMGNEQAGLEEWLCAYFGFAVHLRADTEVGYPDDTHSPGPTIISVATLEEIGRWFGLPLDQVRARFRTNIEISGVPPFWEDCLFGQSGKGVRFRLGDVTFEGINPCQRCVVPARDPVTGELDGDFARRFNELRERTLPGWSARERFNHFYRVAVNTRLHESRGAPELRVGDRLDIVEPGVAAAAASASGLAGAGQPAGFWAGTLVVAEVRDEAPDVKTFRLRHPTRSTLPFRFQPGQFLTVTVEAGKERFRRSYTLASSPASAAFCEVTVKRGGLASGALHDHSGPGTTLAVSGPFGRFGFDGQDTAEVVLIAGGVGITPLMSKLRFLASQGWPGRIDLIYSAKWRQDLIFMEELLRLARDLPGFKVHVTLTAPDDGWGGARGRLTEAWVRSVVPDIEHRHVRLCGPNDMAASTRGILRRLGVPDARVESESFGGPPNARSAAADDTEWQVRFARSGAAVTAPASQVLLETALAAGVALDSGCLAGVCGRCKAKLLDGEVAASCDDALSPGDKANRLILTCQSRPLSPVVLDC